MCTDTLDTQFKYNEDSLRFFDKFQWIYKHAVTELLTKNCLNEIPDDWIKVLRKLDYKELNEFASRSLRKPEWPPTLLSFVKQCEELDKLPQVSQAQNSKLPLLPKKLCHGLTLKKQYEIVHLVEFIHEKCASENIHTIVDFGSGLGYICQALNYLHGYRVLGFESNENIYNNACRRQLKLFPESIEKVKYFCKTVDFGSMEDIKFIEDHIQIESKNDEERVCMIGLHSCGDLALTSALVFSQICRSKLLIMISCCYHKLELSDENTIKRFGISNCFRACVKQYNHNKKSETEKNTNYSVREIFNRPFLRLACQETATRWQEMSDDEHQQHAFHVLSRAVLELFAFQNNFILKKSVKKATRKSQCSNFDTYLTDILQRYTFNDENQSNNKQLIDQIRTLWDDNKEKLNDVEIFTALQLLLQAPAESLILEDRRCWLTELLSTRADNNVDITAIFESKISPRCHALVARVSK